MRKAAVICLTLPDGRLVLQRRSKNAQIAGGKLGFFGGHIEKGETPEQAVYREIKEETSLNPNSLKIKFVTMYHIKADTDFPNERQSFVFKGHVSDSPFKVFEGVGAEVYSLKEVLGRNDIAQGVRYILENTKEETWL